MAALMDALRSEAPRSVADHRVIAITDFERSTRVSEDGITPIDFPKSDVLVFDLEGGHRIIARPSGTEPKMKLYFDVREPMSESSLEATKARAAQRIKIFADAFSSSLPLHD
jgi:phosphomannomutase